MATARAGQREGFLVDDVELDVEATEVAIPDPLDNFESGENLPPAGLYLLIGSGALDAGEVQECLRERICNGDSGSV